MNNVFGARLRITALRAPDGPGVEYQRSVFVEHLAVCPPCVAYMDTYLQTIRLGKESLSNTEDSSPFEDAPQELIQAILEAKKKNGR